MNERWSFTRRPEISNEYMPTVVKGAAEEAPNTLRRGDETGDVRWDWAGKKESSRAPERHPSRLIWLPISPRQLLHYAQHHTTTAPNLQLHIYASMAFTDMRDEDLFRLIDSSYSNRQDWRERLEPTDSHSTDMGPNGMISDEEGAF